MTVKTYDQKCWDLAKHFLDDASATEADIHELAKWIQEAVEDWFQDDGGWR